MSKVYTIAFRMGVLFNVLLWTVLNLIDFFDARNNYIYWNDRGITASHISDFIWGVPFEMFWERELFFVWGLVSNTIVYVVFAFFFGFLFKFSGRKSLGALNLTERRHLDGNKCESLRARLCRV